MAESRISEIAFSTNDATLIEEAIRRAAALRSNAGIDRAEIEKAVLAEARRGTRSMFGLVKVGSRAG